MADVPRPVADRLLLPQFHLRTMFAAVAVLGVLFAVSGAIGPVASVGLFLALALVVLHVAGNALGTTLRDQSPGPLTAESRPAAVSNARERVARAGPIPRLHQRTALGWVIRAVTGVGGIAGVVLGALALREWTDAAIPGMVVGSISFGVLGAFFGFLTGSFLEMSLRAWWQAAYSSEFVDRASARGTYFLPRIPNDVPTALVADIDAG